MKLPHPPPPSTPYEWMSMIGFLIGMGCIAQHFGWLPGLPA